jgi:hypothetical protein
MEFLPKQALGQSVLTGFCKKFDELPGLRYNIFLSFGRKGELTGVITLPE